MDSYGAALSAIEAAGLANGSDIIGAIKAHVAQVLNEKRTVQGSSAAIGSNAEAILTALGAAGDDMPTRFADAAAKFQALQTASATAAASVKSLSDANQQLLAQVATLGRKATLAQVVAASGASEAVLEVLIPDHSKVTIADGVVSVGGTAWDEWIKDPAVVPFVPALLPAGTKPAAPGQGSPQPKLPTNAAGGEQPAPSLYDRVRKIGQPQAPAQGGQALAPVSPWMR